VKKLLVLSIFIFAFLLYGIYLSLFQYKILVPEINSLNPPGYYDYRGVTNVHSNASTGSGSYSEILQYAKNSKLDWIILTELNQPTRPGFIEGYFQDMLVLTGGEYSYLDSRLLYYGSRSNDEPPSGQSQTQVFFADILSQVQRPQKDFVVLAHPYYARYTWKGDFPIGLNGVEVINLKSILDRTWHESKFRTLFSLFLYSFNPDIAFLNIYSNPEDELNLWDQLNKKQKIIGFAGNDTTAKVPISGEKFIKFPSYETSFGLTSNHALLQTELTGDYKKDKDKVFSALRSGQFYMSLDFLGSPKGFYAELQDNEKNYPMGSEIEIKKDLKLVVELPHGMNSPFQVNVKKDGENYSTSTSLKTILNISAPGIYRVEVRVNPKLPIPRGNRWVPWIYTNNFNIKDSTEK
jgi:hypothetical protein